MKIDKLKTRPWWDYLEEDLQELLKTSFFLIETLEKGERDLPAGRQEFHDYSFVVFPASKAYEGFLKKLFLDLGFITEKEYFGKRFRIGKALNPSLNREKYRDQSVYDKIVGFCGGEELAKKLWDTWKTCRNLLFHWFPKEKRAINFEEARAKVDKVIDAIDAAFKECKRK